jgi:hypothetical protein
MLIICIITMMMSAVPCGAGIGESLKCGSKTAVIFGQDHEGSSVIAREKIINAGIDYDYIPMRFLPIRGLDAKDYKLIIAFLDPGGEKTSLEAFESIQAYLAGGGKAILFLPKYSRPRNSGGKLLAMIGSKPGEYLRDNPGELRKILFVNANSRPAQIVNSVRGISAVSEPAENEATAIAYWHNSKGEQKFPAILKTKFGYVINNDTYGDPVNNQMFIANAAIELLPEIKEKVFHNLAAAYEKEKSQIDKGRLSSRGIELYAKSEQLREAAEKAAREKDFASANSFTLQAKDEIIKAFAVSMPSPKDEERLIFIADRGFSEIDRPVDADATCLRLAKAGFTGMAISNLETQYPSTLWNRIGEDKTDRLRIWVEAAHKHGLKFGPAFNAFAMYKGAGESEKALKEDWRVVPASMYGKASGPFEKNISRMKFCRSHPEVTAYAIKKSLEIIREYPVDYIFYDGIRWGDTCYCGHCKKEFQNDTGIKMMQWPDDAMNTYQKEYNDWRAAHITKVIREASGNIAKYNPKIKLGVFTFRGKQSSWVKAQYWWEWINDVDYIMPMYYISDNIILENLCNEINGLIPTGSKASLLPCLAPNGYYTDDQFTMLRQINLQRKYGRAGIIYFEYSFLNDANLALLKMGPFRNR